MRRQLSYIGIAMYFAFAAHHAFGEELVELNMTPAEQVALEELRKTVKDNEQIKSASWELIDGIPVMVKTVGDIKRPTVIVLHGSGGTEGHHHTWADRINQWGYHAVLVESFKQRGHSNIVGTQAIKPQERVADVLTAAQWIKQQTWSDGQLAMIGFSHGGNTVFETALLANGLFAGGIAYYPYCHGWFGRVTMPIQLHVALEDDWTPASTCYFLYKGPFKSKAISAYEYPNAHHGFDHTRGYITKFPAMTGGGISTVTYGSHPEQAEISFKRVKEFLDGLLKKPNGS